MNLNDYQVAAMRTRGGKTDADLLMLSTLGLCGEAGEFAEIVKKHVFHGREMDRGRAADELGYVLWYLAACAEALGLRLDEIAQANMVKLRARYPDGFVMGGGNR